MGAREYGNGAARESFCRVAAKRTLGLRDPHGTSDTVHSQVMPVGFCGSMRPGGVRVILVRGAGLLRRAEPRRPIQCRIRLDICHHAHTV